MNSRIEVLTLVRRAAFVLLMSMAANVRAADALIVCFGDSITQRPASKVNESWPVFLAQRLQGEGSVINKGIPGSRLLHDFVDESALDRFERDALSSPDVSHVIVLIGTNDLGYPAYNSDNFADGVNVAKVSADEMIAGYRQLIAMAHAKGVKIIGATLTPFRGAGYFSEAGEATRVAVNRWIRESREFDAVVDFDAALRDEARPERLRPEFHDGSDWLHPNGKGHKAMADSIELSIFD